MEGVYPQTELTHAQQSEMHEIYLGEKFNPGRGGSEESSWVRLENELVAAMEEFKKSHVTD